MRQALKPTPAVWRSFPTPQPTPEIDLAAVVYRSRAVKPMSLPELHDLTRASQLRNNRENITGLMLYDDDRFYQWIEGPADHIGRLMGSIHNDPRHTDIEVLDSRFPQARAFGDWSMKLATPGPIFAPWRRDVIEPPSALVADLRKHPGAVPILLTQLVSSSRRPAPAPVEDLLAHLPLNHKTAAILKSVFLTAVIPLLVGNDCIDGAESLPQTNPRAVELAELLTATDQDAAIHLVQELSAANRTTIGSLSATLLEPAARRLGDLWSEDLCSEFDVTLGLSRLQAAVRLLSAGSQTWSSPRPQPLVLVAPEPGELHRLGAALDSTVLRHSGWLPHCEYPLDDNALYDLLSSTWFDVLDLSLSVAFRREHCLPQVKRTIAQARRISRNPALVVVIGGRLFLEERGAGSAVGADHANATALDINKSILKTMQATPSVTASPLDTMQVMATAI